MNDFPYTVSFLDGPAQGVTLDVKSISADILSVANQRVQGRRARRAPPPLAEFSGTPDQDDLGSVAWKTAVVSLTGLTKVGEIWQLHLGDPAAVTNASAFVSNNAAGKGTLSAAGANFVGAGFAAGQTITLGGAGTGFDGSYTILGVTATLLTFTTGFTGTPFTAAAFAGAGTFTNVSGQGQITGADFDSHGFAAGQTAVITGASGIGFNYNGTYVVQSVTATQLTFTTAFTSTGTHLAPAIAITVAAPRDVSVCRNGATCVSYEVMPGDEVPSRVAQRLETAFDALPGAPFTVETRIGLLGDSRMIISRADHAVFRVSSRIKPAPSAATSAGVVTVGGVPDPASVPGVDWTVAAWRFDPGASGSAGVTLHLTGASADDVFSVTGATGVADLTRKLLKQIQQTDDYQPLVSGSQVTFQTPWPTPLGGSQLVAQAGDHYVVKPLNLNTRVKETDQVDTLNVFNGNSPADESSVLTATTLTGLGMGTDLVLAGHTFTGGITYANIESLNIHLGTGADNLTIESTHAGSTSITTGRGADVVRVKTIAGHTTVDTGADNDVITVSNDEGTVDQITALLTIDTGSGTTADPNAIDADTVNISDAADVNNNVGVLTGTTLTGLDMPTVPEVQTIFVKAAGGEYLLSTATAPPFTGTVGLATVAAKGVVTAATPFGASIVAGATVLLSGAGTGYDGVYLVDSLSADRKVLTFSTAFANAAGVPSATVQLVRAFDVSWDAPRVATELGSLFGTTDLTVSLVRSNVDVTYTATFIREQALATFPALAAFFTQCATPGSNGCLHPSPDSTVDAKTAIVQQPTTTPKRTTVQTLTVTATGGDYRLHFLRPNTDGVLQDLTTGPIAWNATAAELEAAISLVLDPNNAFGFRPHTDNIAVTKRGADYLLSFQGEERFHGIAYLDASGLTGGGVMLATRVNGINYYDVETLNITLGSGNDVFNAQGTSAVTNLNTAAGNDAIYVASGAAVALGQAPELVTGTLAGLHGTLNLEGGTGSQRLLISDEASTIGDTGAVMTRNSAQAHAVDPNLAAAADIYMTGFAPAGISFSATGGDFAPGISIWTGWGNDRITVEATHRNAVKNEVTFLNTGLGDDTVTVGLLDGTDGAFVLDTQGPYNDELSLDEPHRDR